MRADPQLDHIYQVWLNGDYTSSNRAMTRATIQQVSLQEFRMPHRIYRSWMDIGGDVRELPNIKTCVIERTLDQDAATCTITFTNIQPLEVGEEPEYIRDIDNEGYYSPGHGVGDFTSRWTHLPNEWAGWIQPDRVIRTYQGYGVEFNVDPADDPNLILTGVWIIDKVAMGSDSVITLTCRDMAELLLDQATFDITVGKENFPLVYETEHQVARSRTTTSTVTTPGSVITAGTKLGGVTHSYNSNYYWTSTGCVSGHCGPHAFDSSSGTYWLSIGNGAPNADYAYEWVEAKVPNQSVGGVRFLPWKGNYVVWVGVRVGNTWQGTQTVPYNPSSPPAAPNHSDEKYVVRTTCGWETWTEINLPKIYSNVTAVRLTFHNLADSNIGTYQYRAGVRTFELYNGPISPGQPPPVTQTVTNVENWNETVGSVTDYVQIVKDICAQAGFLYSSETHTGVVDDPDLTRFAGSPAGRVFGDFESAGTAPQLEVPRAEIDNKPFIDVVRYVMEVLGYVFFVDEAGGIIFRMPNLWQVGNYLTGDPAGRKRSNGMLTIDESSVLVDWDLKLSNELKRKRVVIGTTDGTMRAEVQGKEPIPADEYPLNIERITVWTDQNFASQEECIVMADMIKLRQWWQYRTGTATIPANPMIQIDDQIRIYERRTGEGYIHYVQGISSNWDAKSGKWTMDLTTAWLGEQPTAIGGAVWLFDIDDMQPETVDFLTRTKKLGA